MKKIKISKQKTVGILLLTVFIFFSFVLSTMLYSHTIKLQDKFFVTYALGIEYIFETRDKENSFFSPASGVIDFIGVVSDGVVITGYNSTTELMHNEIIHQILDKEILLKLNGYIVKNYTLEYLDRFGNKRKKFYRAVVKNVDNNYLIISYDVTKFNTNILKSVYKIFGVMLTLGGIVFIAIKIAFGKVK